MKNKLRSQSKHDLIAFNDSFCVTWTSKLIRILHFGPIAVLSAIFYITCISMLVLTRSTPPNKSILGFMHLIYSILELYFMITSYFYAIYTGPGFVPINWKPKNPLDEKKLIFCEICRCYKPPRAHHCRTCNRCVLKMDHHCPWLNTCCGHLNHGYFMHFVIIVSISAIHASSVMSISIGLSIYASYYRDADLLHFIRYNKLETLLILLATGMAIGIAVAVSMLTIVQLRYLAKNETGIESYIKIKAIRRDRDLQEKPFIFPYDLEDADLNISQVLTLTGVTLGNGYDWPVKKGCDQFDFIQEQIKQMDLFNKSGRPVLVTKQYLGVMLPLCLLGLWPILWGPPWCDNRRLKIFPGEVISVSNWNEHWAFGELKRSERLIKKGQSSAPKGWFPRVCARDITHTKAELSLQELKALSKRTIELEERTEVNAKVKKQD